VDPDCHNKNNWNGTLLSMNKVEWVLLDFGNVICGYDFEPYIRFLVETGMCSQQEVTEKVLGVNGLLDSYETGAIDTNEFIGLTQKTLAPKAGLEQVETEFLQIFEEWPSAIAVLPLLASRFRLALISDTNELHFDKMIAPIVTPHVETVVLSYRIGRKKPDTEVFHAFLNRTRARPESCLFFDDFELNVDAARRIGITAYAVSGPLGLRNACLRLGLIELIS
jgi:putative hydrolase of the HAD superfamily